MHQISFKNYLISWKINYVNANMVGPITVHGNLHLKVKFCIQANSPRQTNSLGFRNIVLSHSSLRESEKCVCEYVMLFLVV